MMIDPPMFVSQTCLGSESLTDPAGWEGHRDPMKLNSARALLAFLNSMGRPPFGMDIWKLAETTVHHKLTNSTKVLSL